MYIELKEVEKTIRGVTVLHDLNLRMEAGKVYGLWGKNGCGKTMMMRLICGLIRPTKGTVDINGTRLDKKTLYPASVGILIENPAFLPHETGLKNLMILAGIQNRVGETEVRQAIEAVGLNPDDKRAYRKYSLGMKQRLGIACAVMENPDIVVLDEPINAIDEGGVENIRNILRDLKEQGTLVIVACHDKDEMALLADEVFVMAEGTVTKRMESGEFHG